MNPNNDNPGATVFEWLQGRDDTERLVHFQITDSLVWSFIHRGLAFDAWIFNFNPVLHFFANYVATYFRTLTADAVLAICRFWGQLRPAITPLPILMPGAAIAMPALQPFQHTFANSGGHTDHIWRGMVNSHFHALAIMWEYQAHSNQTAKALAEKFKIKNNIPDNLDDQELARARSDPAERKSYVGELFMAMVDCDNCIDNPLKVRVPKAGRKRGREEFEDDAPADLGVKDGIQVTRVKEAPNLVLEALCWILLDAIIEAQQGNIMTSPWQKMQPNRLYEPYATFRERFDAVVDALRQSKAIIDNMMLVDMVRSLAASPLDNLRRKGLNKEVNKKRKLQIQAGDAVLQSMNEDKEAASGSAQSAGLKEAAEHDAALEQDDGEYEQFEPYHPEEKEGKEEEE